MMSTPAQRDDPIADDDDSLTDAERAVRDRQAREREEAEQSALPYKWRQTLQDVDLTVPLPKGTKGRDLAVKIEKKRLVAGLKGQAPIFEGELHSAVKIDDSTWLIEDGELSIHLEKVNKMEWWKNVLTHHPAIDTTKLSPENSKLSDLDGETRGMVEKMMFDQKQKALGLPTSEERSRLDMLEKFKKQHPELDFSKAKIGF
ncbi:HSP20-like chaperone [Blastocladiella britannica]|nr:HSP20-like chaperone [Blastocladiella britannica]